MSVEIVGYRGRLVCKEGGFGGSVGMKNGGGVKLIGAILWRGRYFFRGYLIYSIGGGCGILWGTEVVVTH